MIAYTPNQIFDLLGSVSCEMDLIEIEHYIIAHRRSYPFYDLVLFTECIENLYQIFK